MKDGDEFSSGSASGCFNFFFSSACKLELLAGHQTAGKDGRAFPLPFAVTSAQRSAKIPEAFCASGWEVNAARCDIKRPSHRRPLAARRRGRRGATAKCNARTWAQRCECESEFFNTCTTRLKWSNAIGKTNRRRLNMHFLDERHSLSSSFSLARSLPAEASRSLHYIVNSCIIHSPRCLIKEPQAVKRSRAYYFRGCRGTFPSVLPLEIITTIIKK